MLAAVCLILPAASAADGVPDRANQGVDIRAHDARGYGPQGMHAEVAGGTGRTLPAVSESDARRFLWQAAWGAHPTDVAFVMKHGYALWLDRQREVQPSLFTGPIIDDLHDELREEAIEEILAEIDERRAIGEDLGDLAEFEDPDGLDEIGVEIDRQLFALVTDACVTGEDQLRQRTAWALMQIVPIRPNFEFGDAAAHAAIYNTYLRAAMDIPGDAASGSYFDFLLALTYSGAMGDWLTYKGNRRANLEAGTAPDENYARELMQLFTIGLYRINPDGTRVLDEHGQPIPTFDNDDVQQLARVFTGLVDGNPYVFDEAGEPELTPLPMRIEPRWHEPGPKALVGYPGSVQDRIQGVAHSRRSTVVLGIEAAIRHLLEHPNHPPHMARLMIMRFTTSNPSPAYIERVARAYMGGGPHGSGKRWDIGAMVRAILLDDDARDPSGPSEPVRGRLLEPLQVLFGAARSLEAFDPGATFGMRTKLWPGWDMFEATRQGILLTPSVFNFYSPSYTPAGSSLDKQGSVAPEMQILDDFTVIEGIRVMTDQLVGALFEADQPVSRAIEQRSHRPRALVMLVADRLDHGWAAAHIRDQIADAVGRVPDEDESRMRATIMMIIGHPEFRVLR